MVADARLHARRRHHPGAGAGLRLRHVRPQPGPAGGGPHALLRSRVPPPQGSQVHEQHRRLAPREPHALPLLLQARLPRVTVEGADDIGSTDRARATASTVVDVDVDVGFGGSGAEAVGVVGAGATAATVVGPGKTAVSTVDMIPGRATVWVSVVKTHDRAWMGQCWSVFWISSSRGSLRILSSFLSLHALLELVKGYCISLMVWIGSHGVIYFFFCYVGTEQT
jgi:hypothetical protein|uniref:Uncharacterized protein n=1 Tax=Zea mays TaxID=4577 RepID=A0A804MEC3_MAIZE